MVQTGHEVDRQGDIGPAFKLYPLVYTGVFGRPGKVDRNLAGVERRARQPHGAVGAGLVHQATGAAVGLGAAEHEDVRRVGIGAVKRLAANEVLVGKVPGETAAKLQPLQHFVTGFHEIGAQLFAALEDCAQRTAAGMRQR